MRNKTSRTLDYVLLGVILLVAAVLRLWKLGQVPFMHDEFSALFRLKYDSLHDLIQYGIKLDGHPAGVQLFLYYWSMVVGWDAFWLKLPFALMGIGSVFLIYVIGQQWFNRKAGLLAAAFFAVSQLTVFYSQIIRPYSAGLFFVLLMTFFWNKILLGQKKPSLGVCIGFALSTCMAALAHNFSAAQAGLIFLTGLFFLKKERRLAYWLSGIGALLLYSPNLPIFFHQTFVNGGIGGWLAKPESTFLVDFLEYTMNYAPLFIFAVGIVIVLPFILQKPEKRQRPMRWVAVAWFVIIFALAYVYSLLREPIIQYSTLIFCYPFLILMAFSFHKNNSMTKTQTVIVVLALLFIGASSLITNRRHYDLMYHQGYDQIAVRMQQDHDSLSDIRFATFTESAKIPEFYQAKTDVDQRVIFDYGNSISDLQRWLHEDQSKLLGFAWTDYADPIWETQAVAYYPWQLHSDSWFTSRYLTLSHDSLPGSVNLLQPLKRELVYSGGFEWCYQQHIYGDSLDQNTDMVGVVATVWADDTIQGVSLVMEVIDNATDSILVWRSSMYDDNMILPGMNQMVAAVRFDQRRLPVSGKTLKTFLWNPRSQHFAIVGMDYYVTTFNTKLTGLYQPL